MNSSRTRALLASLIALLPAACSASGSASSSKSTTSTAQSSANSAPSAPTTTSPAAKIDCSYQARSIKALEAANLDILKIANEPVKQILDIFNNVRLKEMPAVHETPGISAHNYVAGYVNVRGKIVGQSITAAGVRMPSAK